MLLFLFIALIGAAMISYGQDSLAKRLKDTVAKKDIVKEKPIADSVEYISNDDLNKMYKYIGDRTSGTQYFDIFMALDNAIKDVKSKAADRYRKKKKRDNK